MSNKVNFKYCNPYVQTESGLNRFNNNNNSKNRFNNINDSLLNSGNARNDAAFKISNLNNNFKKNITESPNRLVYGNKNVNFKLFSKKLSCKRYQNVINSKSSAYQQPTVDNNYEQGQCTPNLTTSSAKYCKSSNTTNDFSDASINNESV